MTKVNWSAEDHAVLYNASQNCLNSGFSELVPKGHYIVSSYQNNLNDIAHIGQIRVSFEYDRCGPATVIAQQIINKQE